MAAIVNDGSVQYGSRVLSINSVSYVADNIEVNRPTKTITRTNELDEPDGQVTYADYVTGSATLQLESGATVIPVAGLTFSATFIASIGAETFYLENVDQPEVKDAEKKVNITFRKQYN